MSAETLENDAEIIADDRLLRRIPYQPAMIVEDKILGVFRPSSAAFQDHPDGSPMSIDIESELNAHELSASNSLSGHEHTHALASLNVGVVRDLGLGVVKAPISDNPAHGHVTGLKSRKRRKAMAKASDWVVFDEQLMN